MCIRDRIYTVRQVLSKAWEQDIDIYNIFVDFRQAYDSTVRDKLCNILYEFEIPVKLVRMINLTMANTEAQVRIQRHKTEGLSLIHI